MPSSATGPTSPSTEAARALHALLDAEWERTLNEFPLLATELGDRRQRHRWPNLSLENLRKRNLDDRRTLEALDQIDVTQLSPADQLNYRLFRRQCETAVEEYEFQWYLLPLSAREGIQDASTVSDAILFETAEDHEDWLARLRSFPEYMDQTLALLREGISRGMVQPRVVMQRVPDQIRRQLVKSPHKSPFFKPFKRLPAGLSTEERERLSSEARSAIENSVIPAYRQMLRFFEEEYLPACLDRPGIWQLPRGQEMYAFFARKFTTTSLPPAEIHRIGRDEVQRIRAQMEEVMRQTGFQGTWPEFLEHLRTDSRFYYQSPEILASAYWRFCHGIDGQMSRLFHRLPKVGYDLRAIPDNIAPDTTTAYYRPPSADGRRPGTYFINLYRPETRPNFEIPVLSLHEAVPGHHTQIARAMELEGLPAFRRYAPEGAFTGYVEGWALYAESLGEMLGAYEDPYTRFGQLMYEIWRAVRLVVDTGMHALGWSREESIDYFLQNTAKARHDIENEVDRYMAWPGQALAYKIGELEISRLKRWAQSRLGSRFDLRDFHEVILENGPLPLDILEDTVRRWVEGPEEQLSRQPR